MKSMTLEANYFLSTHPRAGVYAVLLEDSHLCIPGNKVKAGMVVIYFPEWRMLTLASDAEPRRHS